MNNIKNLTKIYLVESFGSMFAKNNLVKTKPWLKIMTILLLTALIGGNLIYTFWVYAKILETANMANYILYYGIIMYNLLALVFLSFQTQNIFFNAKDYSLIASLPIKSKQVIIAKVLSLLSLSYIYMFIIFIPAYIMYYIFVPITLLSVLYSLLLIMLVPFLNLFVTAVLIIVINFLSSKSPNKTKANATYLTIFAVILIFAFMYINYEGLNNILTVGGIPQVMHYLFPTASTYFYAVDSQSIMYAAITLVSHLALFVVSVFMLAMSYHKINRNFQNKATAKVSKKPLSYDQKPVLKSLFKVELKYLFNTPLYLMNAGFGMVMLVVIAIGAPIYFAINYASITDPNNVVMGALLNSDMLLFALTMIPLLFIGINNTTNISISIEGKTFNFKKSLPIKFQNIVWSKVLVNIVFAVPVLLYFATFIPMAIILNLEIYKVILAVVATMLYLLWFSLFGFMLNLWFPKMNWTNVTVVIKQSLTVFITVMLGIFIPVSIFMLYFSKYSISAMTLILCIIGTLVVLTTGSYLLIVKKGEKLYNKINA